MPLPDAVTRTLRAAVAFSAMTTVLVIGTTAGSASVDSIDRAGELVFSYDGFVPSIDPHKNPGGQHTPAMLASYDRLIHLTPEGEFTPGLATEWTVADDGLSMDLTLREGVQFHDGTPFDVDAVRRSLERAKEVEGAVPSVAANASRIGEVQELEPDRARLVFTEPYFSVIYDLTLQLGAMISPAALDRGADLDSEEAGAGPYQLVTWRPGESIVLERFEDYWDSGVNPLARLEIRNLSDSQTRLNAATSGQVDVVSLEARQSADAESAGLEVTDYRTLGSYSMFVNGDLFPAWTDGRVRQAFQHAVDRVGLVAAVTDGRSEPAVQPIVSTHPAYNPDYPGDYFEYDPDRARALLEEAGIDGLELNILVPNRPEDVAIAEILQGQLGEVGVSVTLEVTEPQNFTIFTGGDAQAFIGTWSGRLNAIETLQSVFLSGGLVNPGEFEVPGLRDLVEEAGMTPLGPERDALLQEAFGIVASEGAQLTFYTLVTSWATTECVAGFAPYAGMGPDLRGVGIREGCG